MHIRDKIIGGVVVIGVLILIVSQGSSRPAPATSGSPTTVTFSCESDKSIIAQFYAGAPAPTPAPGQPPTPTGSVKLTLSDGRGMTLSQTISADGARYANADESFIFWGKGNGALVLENNEEKSFIGCIVVTPQQGDLSQFYSNSSVGFSLRLPQGFSVDPTYTYQLSSAKTIKGVKFTIPAAVAAGTTLGSDTYLSVETIPQVKDCTAALFLDQVKASTLTEGPLTYSVATSTGAGAGNRYVEGVYAFPGTNPCLAVRYYVHYSVLENYPAGSVKQYDAQALLSEFDLMRHSLVVAQ